MSSSTDDSTPLFCVQVLDKKSGHMLYVNVSGSDQIEQPPVEITEQGLIREISQPSLAIEDYKVPLQSSPIFWSEKKENGERDYVIEVRLNDRFAYRKVIKSVIIKHYVISVTLSCIMDKFNVQDQVQSLGHELDLDQPNYKILDKTMRFKRTEEVVRNKIVVIRSNDKPKTGVTSSSDSNTTDEPVPYDLHLRPAIKALTCSIRTETIPKSVGFNDDRLRVELDEERVLDIYLPIQIDLSEAAKYRFHEHNCLFRIVFMIKEN